MRILLIEDDLAAAFMLACCLEVSHEVRCAACSDEAIYIAKDFCPQLIITDWNIKDRLSGVETCEAIKKVIPQHSVFIMSGSSLKEVEYASKTLKPQKIFLKPVDVAAIGMEIEKLTEDGL